MPLTQVDDIFVKRCQRANGKTSDDAFKNLRGEYFMLKVLLGLDVCVSLQSEAFQNLTSSLLPFSELSFVCIFQY